MAKEHWTFEHPSDIGLEARGESPAELLEALAEGLAGEICDLASVRPDVAHTLDVEVPKAADGEGMDAESLAVDFLTAVMNHIQVRHFMVHSAAVRIEGERVLAQLSGESYDPARHEVKVEIKAVTYHQLVVRQEGRCWYGRVILDI